MITSAIPFIVPANFQAALSIGNVVRYGSVLKDSATGRIVAHLQETGMLQKVFQSGLPFNPLDPIGAVTGLIGVVQNEQIKRRIDVMQSMLGGMQTLQVASLVSSVVGIGVTVASTAIILHRLKAVDAGLATIEGKINALPAQWRDLDLHKTLTRVETQLERLQEISARQDPRPVVQKAEEALHEGFNILHAGVKQLVAEVTIDERMLQSLLAGLALCGGAQIKSLFWLDEKEAARERSRRQVDKLQELAFLMPRDVLSTRLQGGADAARQISQDASEIRLRIASQPALSEMLIQMGVNGRTYLERVEQEEEQPLLILPVPQAAIT